MDAVEFLRDFRRMCWTYKEPCCENCKLEGGGCNFTDLGCDHEKTVRIVEEWAKEHPVKTRLSELLKVLPNCRRVQGYPEHCILEYDSKQKCMGRMCIDCKRIFWLTPIEEETNDSMDKIPEEW